MIVFAGNSESRTSFNRTATEVVRKVPQLINGNCARDPLGCTASGRPQDTTTKFLYGRNGCLYERKHIRALGKQIGKAKGQVNVLPARSASPHRQGGAR